MAEPHANILVRLIQHEYKGEIVKSYAHSFVETLQAQGFNVTLCGKGTDTSYETQLLTFEHDFFIDLDCGRDREGNLHFLHEKCPLPAAVIFTDSHGNPTLHKRAAKNYDHVFFAVWDKRQLFENHPSAHWLPNATDTTWFNPSFKTMHPEYDFGFFGSKGGLHRADPLIEICKRRGWTYNVSQICPPWKHMWPATAEAMGKCRFLFNHGQKHDLNLRVFESMAMGIPLISDFDIRSGSDKLFEPWTHYIPYTSYTYDGLEYAMEWAMENELETYTIAEEAHKLVASKHLVHHRVEKVLETIGASR